MTSKTDALAACPYARHTARRAFFFAALAEIRGGQTETRLRTMPEGACLDRVDFDHVLGSLETLGLARFEAGAWVA